MRLTKCFHVAVSIAAASWLYAQPQLDIRAARPEPDLFRGPRLSINADLVLVPVIVTNRKGVAVTGLTASSFSVVEDKTAQPIVSLGLEDTPASIGVVVDLSTSMQARANRAAVALRAFFDAADPADEASLLTLSTRPGTVSAFTSDFGLLEARLFAEPRGGDTALIDAIFLSLRAMHAAHNTHKALLVISDGGDNHSRYSERELLRLAEESDVQIFTLGMTSLTNRKPIELTGERNGLSFLSRLAERTGGLSFTLASYQDPAPAASLISRAIHEQYLIGFHPADSSAGSRKWRPIQVRVSMPQTHVSSRAGYYTR
jgi:Ca-activated chloride channel family protein